MRYEYIKLIALLDTVPIQVWIKSRSYIQRETEISLFIEIKNFKIEQVYKKCDDSDDVLDQGYVIETLVTFDQEELNFVEELKFIRDERKIIADYLYRRFLRDCSFKYIMENYKYTIPALREESDD